MFAEEEAALLGGAATGPALESLVARRCAGEPLEQLLGWTWFCGRRVTVAPGVFVPRRRTQLLVGLVTQVVRRRQAAAGPASGDPGGSSPCVVVDLCCGSGAIGAAVEQRLGPATVEVWAGDADPAAVACARGNLAPERVVEGDLYDALPRRLRGRLDVVVVNAPYVPTGAIATMPAEARDHEPRLALDGGSDGLDLQRRVLAEARPWLSERGVVVIETSRAQAAGTLAAARAAGLRGRVETDDSLDATAVVASAP